jgi:hypothetical protein
VTGTVRDSSGTPLANQVVYVRVGDPPDPSSYVPPTASHRFDNVGGYYSFLVWGGCDNLGWCRITTDASGRFAATMGIDRQYAGNNQEVEASAAYLDFDNFYVDRCTPSFACYKSGVFTAWRRMFMENDLMFRQGTFIRLNVSAGATTIPVVSKAAFTSATPSAPIHAVLMHTADILEATTNSYYEEVNVIGVGGNNKSPTLLLAAATNHPYQVFMSDSDSTLRIGDAVGKFTSIADLWGAETYLLPDFFATMYTDIQTLSSPLDVPVGTPSQNPIPFVPYVDPCPTGSYYCAEVAARSFDNRTSLDANPNHIHLVAAAYFDNATAAQTYLHRDEAQWAYSNPQGILMYNRLINATYGNSVIAIAEATAHEVVHVFDVNQPAFITFGHCADTQIAFDGRYCLMSAGRPPTERMDGFLSLHVNLWGTSEYRRVRNQLSDPVPFHHQTTFDPNY